MMKAFLLSCSALALAGSAVAADLPSRKAPVSYIAPPPVFTWTGFYVGLNAGYGWSSGSYTTSMLPGTHLGAPANVVATERERAEKLEALIANLEESLRQLG